MTQIKLLYSILPKDICNIIDDYAKDRTNLDNYDKVMQQLNLQSSVHDYGFYLTFRKSCHFESKFYSTLDNFSEWSNKGLYCDISDPVMNCEGKLKIEGITRFRQRPLNGRKGKPCKKYDVL